MGRFKIKKADIFIDMTPMSDVMLLLLTFFLMAGTFTKPEPVQVNTPGSVSDIKIPTTDVLTVFISTPTEDGSVPEIFLSLDNGKLVNQLANDIEGKKVSLCTNFKKEELDEFRESQSLKVKIGEMVPDRGSQDDATTDSQFKQIIKRVRGMYDGMNSGVDDAMKRNLRIAIKSDKTAPYSTIKLVMNSLQDIQENRYNLLTELKGRPTD